MLERLKAHCDSYSFSPAYSVGVAYQTSVIPCGPSGGEQGEPLVSLRFSMKSKGLGERKCEVAKVMAEARLEVLTAPIIFMKAID